ncbi:unnamed protein product [Lactuca virosa]|uniref:F-box domain-containing protein n=1 Tax=Lactuca virosa TaxID=75947 RepID=A0AAU9NTK1_9ASTR|nr:unnamed protein product [Lactuca virosa]
MEKNIRRAVSCGDEDRISNLPEHLIDSILERLPFEDAVKTSIISKKWRYRWTTMRALIFDEQFFKKVAKKGAFGCNGFIRIIYKVMILHKVPILKFHLHIPNIYLDSLQEVDQWMLLLSRNGVTELVLKNLNRRYELPSYLFSCLDLIMLDLQNCFYKPPLEFEGFLNLEELILKHIDFGARLCETKINLPQLKKLSLHTCTNAYNFNIKATKLQYLTVVASPDAMLLQLIMDSPCVSVAVIALQKPIQDFVRVEKMNLATMLSNLPRVKDLYIDKHFLKFLVAEKIPKLLPCVISSLKRLWLLRFQLSDLHQLHGALCLLRNSPNLETLYMIHMQEPRVNVGLATNHLVSPNCLDFTLDQLQTIEIRSLVGSKAELFL